MSKKKATEAKMKIIAEFEKKAYFKTLVRFPADQEEAIRSAAGDSLNGFIVKAVLEKVEQMERGESTNQNTQSVHTHKTPVSTQEKYILSDYMSDWEREREIASWTEEERQEQLRQLSRHSRLNAEEDDIDIDEVLASVFEEEEQE